MSSQQKAAIAQFIDFNDTHPLREKLKPSYYQLGFICSVQALPELVDLELWLPLLWEDKNAISFHDEQQATEYANQVLALVETLHDSYQQAIPLTGLPVETWLTENQQVTEQASDFCSGYISAIELFNENWLVLEQHPEAQNILQTVILLLSKLRPAEQTEESLQAVFAQLPEAAEILEVMPKLLTNLAYSVANAVTPLDS